jgi:nickel-dependent lactate racemase
MAGHDRMYLKPDAIKKAVSNPIGMKPLREYARGKKEVVILFDDMARVTRVAEIVPPLLAELAAAGIKDRQIRFICACGCHGALDRADFVKKLGEDVLKRFPVYNHNPFNNCIYAGTTTGGTRIGINAEVMKCDLKIGIGSVVPHIMAGFGGGSKIVLPGVAAYETVLALHSPRNTGAGGGDFKDTVSGMGAIDDNPRRRDIDEAAAIAGLDMIINAVVNGWGETVALFAGSPKPAYAAALKEAQTHYLTPQAKDKDIVIANTFAKASEAISGLLIAFPSVKKSGGDVVLIANAPEGQATHYLMGSFGNSIGGQLRLQMKVPENVKQLIIYNEYPELASRQYLEDTDRVIMTDDWAEVIRLLETQHGPGTKAAVYPNADIQYSAG